MNRRPVSARKLDLLRAALAGRGSLLIVMQDYPDPDAIASAAALRELAKGMNLTCSLAFGGFVGRAENAALVRYLDLNPRRIPPAEFPRFEAIAMVDTQPGAGNNPLPEGVLPDVVIDHHPALRTTRRCRFTDIRSRYGATATILFEYLAAAGIDIGGQLATAMLYAIRSDTQDLGEEAGPADMEAGVRLYPLANKRMLSRIEHCPLPRAYYEYVARALRNARTAGPAIVTHLGPIDNPDIIGEIADFLLRFEDASWALCTGVFQDRMLLSLRTEDPAGNAGEVARRITRGCGTGGGHRGMAGGQVPLPADDRAATAIHTTRIERGFLRALRALRLPRQTLVQGAST